MDSYRPLYHLSPVSGWMNDPNGLIWNDGEYHLFYQWHPDLTPDFQGMHWHHAASGDLVHWQHLQVALEPDPLGAIWSGSAVADAANTSGLFSGTGGLVAVFTHHAPGNAERQSLAFSADRGRTWAKYAGNPVLGDDTCRDFRDPKVFWHAPTQRWVMVVGVDHQLFASPNLRDWTLLSKPGFRSECPDLFPLPIEGTDQTLWALSLGGRQVIIGTFDGRTFVPQSERVEVDAGPDFYAAQSWDNVPGGRRIWIGWLNNWQYAQKLPSFGARGSMSIPRELSLRRAPHGRLLFIQKPVAELQSLRLDTRLIESGEMRPGRQFADGDALEILATIRPEAGDRCGIKVAVSGEQETLIGYDAGCAFLDRSRSGLPVTGGRSIAPLTLRDGTFDIQIFIDRSSVEVFFNDGEAVFSSLIHPTEPGRGVEWFSGNGKSGVQAARVHRLAGI